MVLVNKGLGEGAAMSTVHSELSSEQDDDLYRLHAAFQRGYEEQNRQRQLARRALIALLRQSPTDPERQSPIDSVARSTGLHAEEVHLALGSLLADGTVHFQQGFELAVDEEKLATEQVS
jgi:hypothetical protein